MATPPPKDLTTALNGALGAIAGTRAAVKQAAAQVYTPPTPETSHPAPSSGPAGTAAP